MVKATILRIRDGAHVAYPNMKGGFGLRVIHPQTAARSKNFSVSLVYIAPGGSMEPHKHENEEVYISLEGKGKGHFGFDNPTEIEKGMFIYLPPNCVHGVENAGDEMLVIMAITSPPWPPAEWKAG